MEWAVISSFAILIGTFAYIIYDMNLHFSKKQLKDKT